VTKIPESHSSIFKKRAFAHVATTDPDGAPQVTPVWVDYDGEYVLINSAKGRKKDRNLRERPERVALSVQDPDDPYRYVGLQGRVVEVTEEGAEEMMHRFAYKYWGKDRYPLPQGQVRVIYKIAPERVWVVG
jgi:PPOX class probable F420-dependent enzyme